MIHALHFKCSQPLCEEQTKLKINLSKKCKSGARMSKYYMAAYV